MKVAIFINKNELTTIHEEKVCVVIFDIEDDKVVGVENIDLKEHDKKSIENWLKQKAINRIYLSQIDDHTHEKLKLNGIKVRTLDKLENDKLFKRLGLITS
jgi:predicted Fe-Mo cluster-binding NifX family protein